MVSLDESRVHCPPKNDSKVHQSLPNRSLQLTATLRASKAKRRTQTLDSYNGISWQNQSTQALKEFAYKEIRADEAQMRRPFTPFATTTGKFDTLIEAVQRTCPCGSCGVDSVGQLVRDAVECIVDCGIGGLGVGWKHRSIPKCLHMGGYRSRLRQ